MEQDIFVGVLCVLALAAGFWGWWIDNGSSGKKKKSKNNEELTNK